MKQNEIYEHITEKMIEALEGGVIPWRKSWDHGLPRRMSTGDNYRGINAFLLSLMPYSSPWWGTYKQINELDGRVKGGEKSTIVIYWNTMTVPDEDSPEPDAVKTIRFMRSYNVFNLEQTEGLEEVERFQNTGQPFEAQEGAESIIGNYADAPLVIWGEPAYSPSWDRVMMPKSESFASSHDYYQTLFHELVHSTGHQSRLGRFQGDADETMFGSESYSKEELIAEMGASFLSAMAGLSPEPMENSVAYIGNWLGRLKNDKRLVVQAAGNAQRATNYILGRGSE